MLLSAFAASVYYDLALLPAVRETSDAHVQVLASQGIDDSLAAMLARQLLYFIHCCSFIFLECVSSEEWRKHYDVRQRQILDVCELIQDID